MDMNGTYAFQGNVLAPADAGLRNFNLTEWLVRDVVGAPSTQAYYLAGSGSFTNATVTLPPRAPGNP